MRKPIPFLCLTLATMLAACSSFAPSGTTEPIPATSTEEIPIMTPAPPTDTPTITPTFTSLPPGTDGEWSAAPPMQNARSAHAVVGTEDAIYALAGTGESYKPVIPVEKFDGSQWRAETRLRGDGLNAPVAAVVEGRIYLIGGFVTTTNQPTDAVSVYDIASQKWSEAASLPAPRGGAAATVLDGKIHVVGGGNSQRTLEFHSMYDPANDTWTDLAPLPRSEGSPAVVAVNGRLYVIGGRSGNHDYGEVYVYDPATDSWSNAPGIEPRGTGGAVFYCNAIFYFGGESQARRENLSEVLRFNLESGVWDMVRPMSAARNYGRAVLLGDSVYIVGGNLTGASGHASLGSDSVERFHLNCP